MRLVTAAEMQAMDRRTIQDFGIPGRILMENAGRGATRCFLERIAPRPGAVVGVLAGRGNNGGDGFVIARYLGQRGVRVRVYLLAEQARVQGDAAANLALLPQLGIPVIQAAEESAFNRHLEEMRRIDCWVDAILGTGLTSDVQGYFKSVIAFLNQQQKPVMAVDIPSGLNADTGQPCGIAVQAAATATFGFAKIGHLVYPGASFCGAVEIVDIGIPPLIADRVGPRQGLITAAQVRNLLGQRAPETHKGRTGHVLVVAGSPGKTGAAAMTAQAALRAGAGLVSLAIPAALNPILETLLPEVMTIPLPDQTPGLLGADMFASIAEAARDKDCLALGPGLGTAASTRALVDRIVREIDIPLVVDADGLNNLAQDLQALKRRKAPAVLTPHPGEMARLTRLTPGRVQQDRITTARDFSCQLGAHVVLKGARTLVAEPSGEVWINPTGNPGMASGGMGDVLTGLIAGLIAQGAGAAEAARAGVYLHGLAADHLAAQAPWGYLATEVIAAIPAAMRRVTDQPPEPPIAGPSL